ncbi:MAG: sulfatase-like hydrolase/transferase, partial [Longimicrobiales bacterium]
MSDDTGARSPEATFTAGLLLAAGAALLAVTAGADWLRGSGWEPGRVQVAVLGLGAASIFLGVAFLRLPFARRVAVRLWPFGTDAPAPLRDVFAFAFWMAVLSGALEVGLRLLQFKTGWRWSTLNPHSVWMVPLVDAVTLTALAIPLAAFARRGLPHLGAPRFALFVLLTLAVGAPLSLFSTELRRISVALFTLGVAFQASGWIAARRAGVRVWVRRSAVPLAAILALVGIAPWARQAWSERFALAAMPAPPTRAPNVLLIILDTVRAQNMSLYGYGRRTTPWLEQLAERSTVFDRAYAPSTWTLPSHGSFFTGHPPHRQSGNSFTPLDDALPTLSEVLRDNGYYTLGIVANSEYAFPHTGLHRGFLRYDAGTAAFWEMLQASRIGALWRWGLRRVGIYLKTRKDADTINERFLENLDRRGERPFFAFLNYFDAHYPFDDPLPPASSIGGWADNAVQV